MLSAFAARKARLEQNKPADDTTIALVLPDSSLLPSGENTKSPPSKRKPSSQGHSSPRKKKNKINHGEVKKLRYFPGKDEFATQEDIIVVEDDDYPLSSSGDEEEQTPSATTASKLKRGWSPSRPVQDSSDSEDVEVAVDEILDIPASLPSQPSFTPSGSTFRPVHDQNFFQLSPEEARALDLDSSRIGNTGSVLALNPRETVVLLGVYKLTVLSGSVSLCGIALSASLTKHRVFAPRASPVPVLECLPVESRDFDLNVPARIRRSLAEKCAIILLEELRTNVEGLGRICRTFDGVFDPSRWYADNDASVLGLSGVHLIMRASRDIQLFSLSPSWDSALSSVAPPSSPDENDNELRPLLCLVKGPKNSGKSTFARTLVNRLLSRYCKVAFLECDLGQSEFTPGGMVALNIIDKPVFGPPFTHLTIPHLAHYVGSTSPRSSPSHYLSAIQALLQAYRLDVQFSSAERTYIGTGHDRITDVVPLVVNTMGWTKGLGADLMQKIEGTIEPTHIFEFEAPVAEYGWSSIQPLSTRNLPSDDEYPTKRYLLDPIDPSVLSTNFTAADHRVLSILSYLHSLFPTDNPSSNDLQPTTVSAWDTALPLCARRPYEVDWSTALDGVYLTGAGAEDVIPSEVPRVLNCAIVALVSCEPGALDSPMDANADDATTAALTLPYVQGASPPPTLASNCHGLALIRAVSSTSSHLHVLTPLPPSILSATRVIIKGELELPVWGMLDFRADVGGQSVAGVENNLVPYLRWGKEEGIGGERRRVRRNLMRKGQM